jgi:hypothetical protein
VSCIFTYEALEGFYRSRDGSLLRYPFQRIHLTSKFSCFCKVVPIISVWEGAPSVLNSLALNSICFPTATRLSPFQQQTTLLHTRSFELRIEALNQPLIGF